MKNLLLTSVILCLYFACQPAFGQVNQFGIAAITTDANIDLDFSSGDTVKHQIYINQAVPPKNKLLVFLPGTSAKPKDHYSKFCRTAANEGYHTIGLKYKNGTSIADICGTDATAAGPTCSEYARMEIIYGTPLSSEVTVDSTNSIMNRLIKLLYYLEFNHPSNGWDNFIDTTTMEIQWQNIALAGHSQGGGHVALIARDISVNRVLLFNSPSDRDTNLTTPLYQPQWFSDPHITNDSVYYAFYHQQNSGNVKLNVFNHFGLGNYGLKVNVDTTSYPYGYSHILYTDSITFDYPSYINPACLGKPAYDPHSDIIVDCTIPINTGGNTPYQVVWKYMLNNTVLNPILSSTNEEEMISFNLYPNPTDGLLYIDVPNKEFTVSIYTPSGSLIKKVKSSSIDLSGNPNGLYFIKIQIGQKTILKKFIKKST